MVKKFLLKLSYPVFNTEREPPPRFPLKKVWVASYEVIQKGLKTLFLGNNSSVSESITYLKKHVNFLPDHRKIRNIEMVLDNFAGRFLIAHVLVHYFCKHSDLKI